jgi:tRNA A-37 threonylcarbamoyl transferase component Bud32
MGTINERPDEPSRARTELEPPKRADTDVGTINERPAGEPARRADTDVGTINERPSNEPTGTSPAARGSSPVESSATSPSRASSSGSGSTRASSSAVPQLPEPDFDAIARTPLPVRGPPSTTQQPSTGAPSTNPSTVGSLNTVADVMHAEEVRRTRQFIAMGWAISVAAIGAVPFLDTPRYMSIAMVAALVWGIVMSSYFYRRFADPSKYSENQMVVLGALATINTHVAIFYFGTFTAASVIIVLGMHFVARSEAVRGMRILFATAVSCYVVCATIVISGVIDDPGVFASEVTYSRVTLLVGALFVIGAYALAFYTGRAIRDASTSAIDALQRQTRLAAQRKALMDELRADLERALHIDGPGRHTDQVVGSFKLGNVIGRGAMGEVYEAMHTSTDEMAAVKLLRRELVADATHVARFLRETKASAALASPYVARVIEADAGDGTIPYLAMERLHGETLAEMLRSESRLPAQTVVALCKQVGAGIDTASAAGIVHRDLKPQNMMLARENGGERWKILDFGVATLADDTGTLTQGGIIGTPSYMAPEQARGERVDGRADVYALAAVAYRCLTGRHPFTAPDTPALLFAVVHRMPLRPGDLGSFHEDLDRWAAIALAKSPDDRFATGAELADALAMAIRGELDAKNRKRADALIKKFGWEAMA